jgi:hypothetical protein
MVPLFSISSPSWAPLENGNEACSVTAGKRETA